MRVIRIEHPSVLNDGRPAGPYQGDPFRDIEDAGQYSCDDEDHIHTYCNTISWNAPSHRPGPYDDGLGQHVTEDHLFGFASLEAMKAWFHGDQRKLSRYGFVAAVYETTKVKHGRHQTIFKWSSAKRIGDAPILATSRITKLLEG